MLNIVNAIIRYGQIFLKQNSMYNGIVKLHSAKSALNFSDRSGLEKYHI